MTTVLLVTDAEWIRDEVDAALGDDETTLYRVRAGIDVAAASRELEPDLLIIDLQIGNMGGMAACLSFRHEEAAGRAGPAPVLLLLDRTQDVFLAERSDADGYLIKPLDAFRLRRAAAALLAGDRYLEGPAATAADHDADAADTQDASGAGHSGGDGGDDEAGAAPAEPAAV